MSLTDTAIKKLKPSEKCKPNRPDKYADGGGLWLYVRNTGNKVFMAVYRYMGKQHEITLGKYPAMSLSHARSENLKIRELLEQGKNPKDIIKAEKAKKNNQTSFDFFAQKWLHHQKNNVSIKTYERDLSIYNNHIKRAFGTKDIHAVNLTDILTLTENLANQGATYTARRIIGQLNSIYSFVVLKQLTPNLYNPIPRNIRRTITHKETKYARIKIQELPKLMLDIDTANIEPMTRYGFYLLAYTFVRTGELLGMTWQEIDLNAKVWRIPAHRMKNGLPHIVPLAPQVIEILQQIKSFGFNSDYVLYSNRSKTGAMSENAFTTALKRIGYQGKMTGHGFRGLASTSLYEMQYNPKAIELQLAHISRDKTERAYNDAEMLPRRIQMMNDWANIVDEVRQSDFKTYQNRLTADTSTDQLTLFLERLNKKEKDNHTPDTQPLEIQAMQ